MLFRVTTLVVADDADEASTLIPGWIESVEEVSPDEKPVDFMLSDPLVVEPEQLDLFEEGLGEDFDPDDDL